jgi:hypothetical protein
MIGFGNWRPLFRLPPQPVEPPMNFDGIKVRVLQAKPGDIVLLRLPERHLSSETIAAIRKQFEGIVPEGVKVGVLTEGMDVVLLTSRAIE